MLQFALLCALATSSDAPVAEPATPAPVVEPAPVAPLAEPQLAAEVSKPVGWDVQYSAGSLAALVAVPASLYLGQFFGTLSIDLIWAAIPTLLSIGLIPPIAVTAATVIVGNWNDPGRYRWWPALLVTTVINGASLAIGAPLGLSAGVFGRVLVYTLVQAVLQPGAAVLVERAWPKQPPSVITLRNEPTAPTTFFVPTQTWSF